MDSCIIESQLDRWHQPQQPAWTGRESEREIERELDRVARQWNNCSESTRDITALKLTDTDVSVGSS